MSEYLSEEEQLAQLKSWWQSYGWWVVGAVVLGLGGYFALEYKRAATQAHHAAASEVFERYQEQAGDEDAARPLLARLDGEYAGTPYHLMSLLTRAQAATDSDDIEAAIGFYETAVAGANIDHLTDLARLRLARAQQQLGRSDAAFTTLASVTGEGYRSLVAELKGDILRAQGKPEAAREAYAAAVEAQGDAAPRTLLAMKLADLSEPEGALATGDVAISIPETTEDAVQTLEDETANALPDGLETGEPETGENEAAAVESNETPTATEDS